MPAPAAAGGDCTERAAQAVSALSEQISDASKAAMRSGDKARLGALRLILAAIKQHEVDTRTAADDAAVTALLGKMITTGRDAAAQFADAGRDDLAEKERGEVAIFEEFMPQQLGEDEISAAVDAAISATGADSARDMGKVMSELRRSLAGRADMGAVSALVRERLSG